MRIRLNKLSRHQYALLAIVALTAPLFFIGGPDYYAAPLYRSLWDAGHLAFFALSGWLAAAAFALNRTGWFIASVSIIALSFTIEFMQQFVGRNFSWLDIYHNLVGFWLGALLPQAASLRIWLLRFLALALTAPLLWQVSLDARLHWLAHSQFPVIADFEEAPELRRIAGPASVQRDLHSHGQAALAIHFTSELYSGISINRLLGNWQGYNTLAMDIYNPAPAAIQLTLRIADRQHNQQYHDRFNQPLNLQPGWNAIALPIEKIRTAPKDRLMDLQTISEITLFNAAKTVPQDVVLDYLRLE